MFDKRCSWDTHQVFCTIETFENLIVFVDVVINCLRCCNLCSRCLLLIGVVTIDESDDIPLRIRRNVIIDVDIE